VAATLGARTILRSVEKLLDVERKTVVAFPSSFFIRAWTFFILYAFFAQDLGRNCESGRF